MRKGKAIIWDPGPARGPFVREAVTPQPFRPHCPERKIHYGRDFLLRLQFTTAAMSKPAGLPKLDIILHRSRTPHIIPGSQPNFAPTFIKAFIPGRMVSERHVMGIRASSRALVFEASDHSP
jgi:hypothetical protein